MGLGESHRIGQSAPLTGGVLPAGIGPASPYSSSIRFRPPDQVRGRFPRAAAHGRGLIHSSSMRLRSSISCVRSASSFIICSTLRTEWRTVV